MSKKKYIALIDCDCFFCSCERKLNPELEGKALCVVSGERGCVISRSNEAKKMGIPMGYPLFKAVREYPDCIYITANHENYLNISKQVMAVIKDFSPNVEVYSIDEAFADLTGLVKPYKKNYFKIAKLIQEKIMQEAGIPVSIGVSRSKTLAKLASDRAKKTNNRVVLIGKCKIDKYLQQVDVSEIWGIGRKLTSKLRQFGIDKASKFIKMDDKWIKTHFGINGLTTKYELSGNSINNIASELNKPKSILDTQSFPKFTSSYDYLKSELNLHIHSACRKLRRAECKCKRIGIIVKTKDFKTYFSETKLKKSTDFELDISRQAINLFEEIYNPNIIYRSIGIFLGDFVQTSSEQLSLFEEMNNKKTEKLGKVIDMLEERFGKNIIKIGFVDKDEPNKQDFMTSPNYDY